ncbi:hypothetical protein QAD02_007148 [Eretmocerus hayati]|uniref:Uncharacterized protein n=1 Tax=Eretmocerus hayati TaxID=131215 RepID=A0ACC2N468_9HYME|nr:hypothetical protein QAD02_007148 [Eretmocerus hayati]
MDFQQFQAKAELLQTLKAARKYLIQTAFGRTTILLIGIVEPGSGTSDDGNTPRRILKELKMTSEILSLNLQPVKMFKLSRKSSIAEIRLTSIRSKQPFNSWCLCRRPLNT